MKSLMEDAFNYSLEGYLALCSGFEMPLLYIKDSSQCNKFVLH